MSYIERRLTQHGELTPSVKEFLQVEKFTGSYYQDSYKYEQGRVCVSVRYGRVVVEAFDDKGNFIKNKTFPFDNDDLQSFKSAYYDAVDFAAIYV